MSDNAPPKKLPFWQMRLGTAILLMLITGVILGLNIAGSQGEFVVCLEDGTATRSPTTPTVMHLYGWPLPFRESVLRRGFDPKGFQDWLGKNVYGFFAVIFDSAIWFMLLGSTFAICEWSRRKP